MIKLIGTPTKSYYKIEKQTDGIVTKLVITHTLTETKLIKTL